MMCDNHHFGTDPLTHEYGTTKPYETVLIHQEHISHPEFIKNLMFTCADFVLDIPHEWSQTRCGGEVGVALHAPLEELFLLGVLLKRQKKLTNIIFLLYIE